MKKFRRSASFDNLGWTKFPSCGASEMTLSYRTNACTHPKGFLPTRKDSYRRIESPHGISPKPIYSYEERMLPQWKKVNQGQIEAGQGLGQPYLNRREPKQCGPAKGPVSPPTAFGWQGGELRSCRRAIHIQECVERTLWDRGPNALQESSKEKGSSLMRNVSGGQKENIKEMVHTNARLTNDDEITKTFIVCLFCPVPRNVPLISYQ